MIDDAPLTDAEVTELARHAGMHGEDHLHHPPADRHPLCDWCQYPHIRACRLITDLRASRAEVERLVEDLRIANESTLVLVALAAATKAEVERLQDEINERDRVIHQAFRVDR